MATVSVETIAVAVIAGVGGGLAGTWLQIRHEREEAFRDRLITAADDLATGLQQAIIGLDEAYSVALKHGFVAEDRVVFRHPGGAPNPARDRGVCASRQADRRGTSAHGSRVAPLRPVSGPDRSAMLALMHLEGALMALDTRLDFKLEEYSGELAGARMSLADFNRYALRDARGRPWWRRWRWVRGPRRSTRKLRERLSKWKREGDDYGGLRDRRCAGFAPVGASVERLLAVLSGKAKRLLRGAETRLDKRVSA